MSYISAQKHIYKALREQLLRPGVSVGETAGYPRVELHSFTEVAPTDKDGTVRSLTCVVESMSVRSYGDAVAMNEENLARLLSDGWHTIGDGLHVLGIVPEQLTELTENLETKEILYRQLQQINVLIWQS